MATRRPLRRLLGRPMTTERGIGPASPIDPAGQMSDGTPFAGYYGLREGVPSRVDAFARGLAEALFSYGLGRPLSFSDEQLVQPLLAETKAGVNRPADL